MRMRFRLLLLCSSAVICLSAAVRVQAGTCAPFGDFLRSNRKALVIGNGTYTANAIPSLTGVRADVDAISAALEKRGFSGLRCSDLRAAEIAGRVDQYFDELLGGVLPPGHTFLFYYSGHGGIAAATKANVLFGVAAKNLESLDDTYRLQDLLDRTAQRPDSTNIIILDSCRRPVVLKGNGPPQPARTFVEEEAPRGTYIAFATSPGAAAVAQPENLSPFTKAVVAELDQHPEMDIDFIFRRVRARVTSEIATQQPWTTHNLTGSFQFGRGYQSLTEDIAMPAAADESAGSDCAIIANRVLTPTGDLRPAIFAMDLVRLRMCDDGVSRLRAEKIEAALVDGTLELRRVSIAEAVAELKDSWKPTPYDTARDDLTDDFPVEVELITRRDASITKGVAGGGKLALIPLHWGKRGHYEITGAAFRNVVGPAASKEAYELVQDASQDPDFYEWTNPAAHAQTALIDDIGLGDPVQSQTAFIQWERQNLQRVAAACKEGQPRRALYWLGYAAHGVQDLVFHGGISNAEHSFRDYVENVGVDTIHDYAAKVSASTAATERLFGSVLQDVPPSCRAAMLQPDGGWLKFAEKLTLLPKRMVDLTPWSLLEYRRYATRVKRALDAGMAPAKLFVAQKWVEPSDGARITQMIDRILTRENDGKP